MATRHGLDGARRWAHQLPRWVMVLFAGYLVLWAVAVGGALVSGCGLAVENITGGAVPRTWGGFAQAVAAFVLIWSAHASRFARVMQLLIVVMFFSVVLCVALTFRDPVATLLGLFVPAIPRGGGTYVLLLIGGIGGSVTLLSHNYLLRDEGKVDPRNLSAVRRDLATAYIFTAVFGLSVMLIANRVFHSAGIAITDREAVSRVPGALAALTGSAGFYIYSIGFWAAVLASLIGVWQTIPSVFAVSSQGFHPALHVVVLGYPSTKQRTACAQWHPWPHPPCAPPSGHPRGHPARA